MPLVERAMRAASPLRLAVTDEGHVEAAQLHVDGAARNAEDAQPDSPPDAHDELGPAPVSARDDGDVLMRNASRVSCLQAHDCTPILCYAAQADCQYGLFTASAADRGAATRFTRDRAHASPSSSQLSIAERSELSNT